MSSGTIFLGYWIEKVFFIYFNNPVNYKCVVFSDNNQKLLHRSFQPPHPPMLHMLLFFSLYTCLHCTSKVIFILIAYL